jgi:homoserine dehydrogenase
MLDAMEKQGVDFDTILKKAQELGFAEADPTNDVDGKDATYKIAILASIISGKRIDCSKIYTQGIRNISLTDIRSAAKRGFRIKLLGIVDNTGEKLDLRVHPCFVKLDNPLANVSREYNAIMVRGDAVQDLTLIGKGAGSLPTASSVLGDILMLSSQLHSSSEPHPQYVCKHSKYADIKPLDEVRNSFYVRISMLDKVGVLKDLGAITANNNANIKFIDQYDAHDGEALADFMIDPIEERSMNKIIKEIQALDSIKGVESVIRVLA